MGLAVSFDSPGDDIPVSWTVVADHFSGASVFLYGFARKADAIIATKAMQQLEMDWDASPEIIKKQWDSYGGRDAVMKYVCERLQW